MKVIDAHMHYSNIQSCKLGAMDSGVDFSAGGLKKEYEESNVVSCVCMGITETAPGLTPDKLAESPMWADFDDEPVYMGVCLGLNPHTLDDNALQRAKNAVAQRVPAARECSPSELDCSSSASVHPHGKSVAGFKVYAGYYHVDINDPVYKPVYKLAADNNLAVAIHCGETYFEGGLLEYSRPIHVDKLAHEFRDLKIIICHLGFPWVMEACEIAIKNPNVYVDISGLAVGGVSLCEYMKSEPLIRDYFRQGLLFLNNYKKVIFGTDWPLVPVGAYIEVCKALIPQDFWEDVFYNNAAKVYNLA